MTLFADNYLAGAVLTLLLPALLLIVIAAFLHTQVKRVPAHTSTTAPSLPDPEVVAAAVAEEEQIAGPSGSGPGAGPGTAPGAGAAGSDGTGATARRDPEPPVTAS